MSKILVVDDEPSIRAAFEAMLAGEGHEVIAADRGETALETIDRESPDLVVTDVQMPGIDGLETFRRIKVQRPKLPVIIITGYGTTDYAIEATKLGAFDYQLKPIDPEEMLRTIERALEGARIMQRSVELGPQGASETKDAIIGQSTGMQQVYKSIGRVAATDATILIRGESGTGKELVARAVYQHSNRSEAPLRVVNCAAIPDTLLESELFGYEKGAFTGAAARRIGKFEQAHGGTIFLDEIGDMPLGIQSKILRVLQERTFERVGGNETISADVRILAATNRRLEKAISEGNFREDLLHRLNVVTIRIPPLRERREDIPLLAQYFLVRFARELNIEQPVLTPEALDALVAHNWPGNVRELEHTIHRTVIFTRGYPIQALDVKNALEMTEGSSTASEEHSAVLKELIRKYLNASGGPDAHERLVDDVDRLLVEEALHRTKGNQTHAAKLLGIPRPTLHAKIRKHGIRFSDEPQTSPG